MVQAAGRRMVPCHRPVLPFCSAPFPLRHVPDFAFCFGGDGVVGAAPPPHPMMSAAPVVVTRARAPAHASLTRTFQQQHRSPRKLIAGQTMSSVASSSRCPAAAKAGERPAVPGLDEPAVRSFCAPSTSSYIWRASSCLPPPMKKVEFRSDNHIFYIFQFLLLIL